MTLAAGTRLGPYEILAPLGAGGMGEVYRAQDTKLDRDVAVKVLPESVAGDSRALSRFEREAKAVAALSHPNILAIHDFGTHGDVSYAVMELLEGETLRGKLNAGAISPKQAVDYALQIAKGLSAAHGRGIVHRDLKPENLFVTNDGHVKILDFGLAKRIETRPDREETNTPTETDPTTPGTVIGTVGYMSPEQVRGLPVDHRSDIFSFGAILYEMLSGQRAFRRQTAADTLAAILKEDPPELRVADARIPTPLALVVGHCLEKDAANRFQSARDLAMALSDSFASSPTATGVRHPPVKPPRGRWAIAGAAVVLMAIAGVLFLRRPAAAPAPAPAPAPAVKRVAVLPFENHGDPGDDYFADGIADAVRGKLISLTGVEVIARGSSMPYRKTTKTPKEIARELETTYLLTATVRWQKSGATSRVQVSPELVEVTASRPAMTKWQAPFDAALTDVFRVQSEIATRVAQELGIALGASEKERLDEKPTLNLAAYDAFLKAENALLRQDRERAAFELYEQAVALDPSFIGAWAGLALAASWHYGSENPTPDLAERARVSAEKALALAPDRPEGRLAQGTYLWMVLGDYDRAREEFDKGLKSAPANVDLLVASGAVDVNLGRWQEGVDRYRKADRLDPRAVDPKIFLAAALMCLDRHAEARELMERALTLEPANLTVIEQKVMTHLGEGDVAGARATLQATPRDIDIPTLVAVTAYFAGAGWLLDETQRDILLRLTPLAFHGNKVQWGLSLAEAHASRGETASSHKFAREAAEELQKQLSTQPNRPEAHADLGLALAYAGEKEAAIREGLRALELTPEPTGYLANMIRHQLIRISIISGDHERALTELESLMRNNHPLTPAWLKIDPNYDPLRGHPRFWKLVAGA